MSVINQMLQDLERRHAGPEDRRALPDEVRPLPAGNDRGAGRRIGAWTLAVASAGAVAWLLTAGRIEVPSLGTLGVPWLSATIPASQAPSQPLSPQVPEPGRLPQQAAPAVTEVLPVAAMRLRNDPASVPPVVPVRATDERPPRSEQGERMPSAGDRQAKRDAANAETERLVRDVAGTPAVSPAVASSFAGGPPPMVAMTLPFVPTPAVAASPAAPVAAPTAAPTAAPPRPVDTSPARIDRQEREPSVRERAEAIYRRGVEAMHEGRMSAAEQALRDALVQFPGHEAARQTLLGILVQQRRNVDAEALLVEGQRQNPAQVGFALALARLQAERGDNASALESLQRSAAAGRERPEFLGFQAGLLARGGRHADAATQYRSALRMAPQNAVWWMGLGISLESDRRPAEAAEAFQRARETPGLNAELTAYVDQRLRGLQR